MCDPLEDDFWADDPYVDEDEDDPAAYDPDPDMADLTPGEREVVGLLAGDFAENGKLDLFGAFDFDLLDIDPDITFPF